MKNVRLFAVAAALGMFASTVAAAETTKPTVQWTGDDTVIKVDLGEKLIVTAPTASVTVTTETEKCEGDANGDGYIDGNVFAVNPEINAEQGWLFTNAKYWPTGAGKTAMYYLGLPGGASVTGGRFLAPGAEENEGTFTSQLDHKNLTKEELVEKWTKSGELKVVYDAEGEIDYIDIHPVVVYTTKLNERVAFTTVYRLDPVRDKYAEDTLDAALVALANGVDAAVNSEDNGTLYTISQKKIAPIGDVGAYPYYATKADYENDDAILPGSAMYIESYKGEYRVVEAPENAESAYDTGYTYVSGEPVAKFAEDKNYLITSGDDLDYTKLIQAKYASFFNQVSSADGAAKLYMINGSVVDYSKEYYSGNKDVKNAAGVAEYQVFDALKTVDAEGNDLILTAEDLLVKAAPAYTKAGLVAAVATGSDLYSSNIIKTASTKLSYKLIDTLVDTATSKGGLVTPAAENTTGNVATKGGAQYNFVTADTEITDETKLYSITKVTDGKVTVSAVGTAYDWYADKETVKATTLVDGLEYAYMNAKGVLTPINSTVNNELTKIDNGVFDLAGNAVYTAATEVEKADTVYNAATGDYYSIADLYEIAKVEGEGTKSKLKAGAINVMNCDDEEHVYRFLAVTPETYTFNDVDGYYLFNEETGMFDFVEETNSTSVLVRNDLNGKYVGETQIKNTTTNEVVNSLLDPVHVDGIYYVTTPANDSDYYVIANGYAGLSLDYTVNTSKGEAYFEIDGETVVTKAVELTVDYKQTRWFPAFETEEELRDFVYAITGLDEALEGTSQDKKATSFKTWYDAAKADLTAGIGKLPEGEVLPEIATQPEHGKVACEFTSTSTSDAVTVEATNTVDTTVAGVYDLEYSATYEGEVVGTTSIKVVVAPNYTRTWENGRVKTLTSYYVSHPTAKYAEYNYNWAAGTVTVTYYNVDGSVNETATNNL